MLQQYLPRAYIVYEKAFKEEKNEISYHNDNVDDLFYFIDAIDGNVVSYENQDPVTVYEKTIGVVVEGDHFPAKSRIS